MAVDFDPMTLDFRQTLSDTARGLEVKPILHNYLFDAVFPKFSFELPEGAGARAPDGWFHPSTHPLWPERLLYFYLANPESMIGESMPYMNTLSVTIGKLMHDFIQTCLIDAKYLVKRDGPCECGDPECKEWGFVDAEAGERGHVDGLSHTGKVFEFKTATEMSSKLRKAEDMDPDWLKREKPDYWAQQQSYLRMSGRRESRVLFFTLGYPWTMKEFVVPFDQHFAYQTVEKYRRVRQAVADQRMPSGCCGFGTKEAKVCPARAICPTLV